MIHTLLTLLIPVALASSGGLHEILDSLQRQYSANEQHHAEAQDRLHEAANKVRDQLCEEGEKQYCRLKVKVDVTSYNPVPEQTDGSPCVGAHSTNLCSMYRQGIRPVGLTRDLLKMGFEMGDRVKLWHPTCKGANGIFQVEDKTRAGLEMRADIFSPDPADNVGLCAGAYLLKL